MDTQDVVLLHERSLITREEARALLGFADKRGGGGLAEAERVLRVISGWNPSRVSTADAIQPAIDYFDAKAVPDVA